MNQILEYVKKQQQDKVKAYRILNRDALKGKTLFTGSSLMENFPVNELLMTNGISQVVYNRGIGGFTTNDMLEHMEEMVFGTEPSRIFINIGTNDIGMPDYSQERLINNYKKILRQIKERLPECEVYLMAYYPVNETAEQQGEDNCHMFDTRNNENIRKANMALENLAKETDCRFIDVNEGLTDEEGRLKKEFTIEGIHMYGNAYQIILQNMRPYLK